MSDKPVKVIVVGGGPVGLTAAHVLSQAGIDYVVLESRDSVTTDVGASLVLWPQGLRVMAQLGLLERLRSAGADMRHTVALDFDSHKYKDVWASDTLEKNHGTRLLMLHRSHLLRMLYESLSETNRARIVTNKIVTEISTGDNGAEVHCEDGSTYRGLIVIGADGVHSQVRQSMRELAIQSTAPIVIEEKPFLAEYRVMWCNFPRQPSLQVGDTYEIHGTDVSLQCLNGRDRSWIFVYERLENPTRDRMAYLKEDVEALAARRAELPISECLKVKDVFHKRHRAGMANVEEGILKHWSWNRLVLVGDACHKLTPNQGVGYNCGIEDVVVLVNELHRIGLADDTRVAHMSVGDLAGAFSRYQNARLKSLRMDYDASTIMIRISTWRNWAYWLLDRYVLSAIPYLDGFMLTYFLAEKISKSPTLDFVQVQEAFQGKVAWKNQMGRPVTKPLS